MIEEDIEYLIRMAHQGADEECCDKYDFHHDKIDRIKKRIKKEMKDLRMISQPRQLTEADWKKRLRQYEYD